MTTPSDEQRLDDIITAYILFLDGEGPRPDLDRLTPEDRDEAAARIQLLDAAAASQTPAGAVDRLARTFGFDRQGTRITLSGPKFKRARQQRNLELKTIAADAAAAGAAIRTSDLLRLETSDGIPFDQETVTILVAILDTSLEEIESDFDHDMSQVQAFLNSSAFDAVLEEWLAEHDRDPVEIREQVTDRILAARFRAADVTEEQLLDFVRAILRTFET